jgi:hypothetical protein
MASRQTPVSAPPFGGFSGAFLAVGVPSLTLGAWCAQVSPDERSAVAYELMTLSVARMLKLLYPLLYRVDVLPAQVRSPHIRTHQGHHRQAPVPGVDHPAVGSTDAALAQACHCK